MKNFNELRLAAPVFDALTEQGYTQPTPIQAQSIPEAMAGRDIMGIAQTGTGKTAAFALPSLHHICENRIEPPKRGARILILAPTRELASQIAVSFKDYGQKIDDFSVETVFGGVKIGKQIKRLVYGNDVIVATPGRLIDLLDRKAIKLSDIEILILDEADQMMDMGFIHALKKIIPLLPKKRQTMFFSATMAPSIAKLAGQFLTDPVKVSVTPANTTAEKVDQRVIFVNAGEKQDLLALSLLDPDIDRALIFTRTKHGADRVVKRLAQVGIEAMAIHGNKSQPQRQKTLKAFRDGDIRFLIATDIAARGIDIEGISHVFNFEIPNVAEQYVHRIGRTARAGRSGVATSFVASDEKPYLKDIQKLLKTQLEVASLPENFMAESAKLKKRTPLPPKPKSENAPRAKGRGKNKKRKMADKASNWSPETAKTLSKTSRSNGSRNFADKALGERAGSDGSGTRPPRDKDTRSGKGGRPAKDTGNSKGGESRYKPRGDKSDRPERAETSGFARKPRQPKSEGSKREGSDGTRKSNFTSDGSYKAKAHQRSDKKGGYPKGERTKSNGDKTDRRKDGSDGSRKAKSQRNEGQKPGARSKTPGGHKAGGTHRGVKKQSAPRNSKR